MDVRGRIDVDALIGDQRGLAEGCAEDQSFLRKLNVGIPFGGAKQPASQP